MAFASDNAGKFNLKDFFNDIDYNLKENIINNWNVHSYHTVEAIRVWIYGIGDEMPGFLSSVESLGSDCKKILSNMDNLKEKAVEKRPDGKTPEYNEHFFNVNITLIGFEIERFLASHDHLHDYNWEVLKEYWYSLCWTKEGKINSLKTAEYIMLNNKISLDGTFLIACNNCLEDKIKILLNGYPETEFKNLIEYCSTPKQKNGDNNYRPYLLALFWTYYFRGNLHQLSSMIGSPSDVYISIVKYAIIHNKDVAVQHLWEKFRTRERDDILNAFAAKYVTRDPSSTSPIIYHPNILLYLIKRKPTINFANMHINNSKCVIWNVERISRQKFVSKPDCVLELIRTRDAYESIVLLSFAWANNILNLGEYTDIFKNLRPTVKSELTTKFPYLFKKVIHMILVDGERNNFPTVQLILGMIPDEIKKDALYEIGLETCKQLIEKEKLEILNLFLNEVFKDETELTKYKEIIFQNPEFAKPEEVVFEKGYAC